MFKVISLTRSIKLQAFTCRLLLTACYFQEIEQLSFDEDEEGDEEDDEFDEDGEDEDDGQDDLILEQDLNNNNSDQGQQLCRFRTFSIA